MVWFSKLKMGKQEVLIKEGTKENIFNALEELAMFLNSSWEASAAFNFKMMVDQMEPTTYTVRYFLISPHSRSMRNEWGFDQHVWRLYKDAKCCRTTNDNRNRMSLAMLAITEKSAELLEQLIYNVTIKLWD